MIERVDRREAAGQHAGETLRGEVRIVLVVEILDAEMIKSAVDAGDLEVQQGLNANE